MKKRRVNQETCKIQDVDWKEETEDNFPAILNRVKKINAFNAKVYAGLFHFCIEGLKQLHAIIAIAPKPHIRKCMRNPSLIF